MTQKQKTHRIAVAALLAAVAAVLQFVEFSIPVMPAFIKLDISDLPALLGTFSLGPVYGVAIQLVKNLLHLPFGSSAGVGELSNFLLGAVFACREDIWSPTLQAMGRGLGGFIYLMDAYDDLPKDARKGQFNALQELHDTLPPTEFEDRCHDLLTQQMGLCAQQFELLPILKETPEGKLLYNTIYSGVWSKYAPIRKHREGKQK